MMAPMHEKKLAVVISYSKAGTQPPIYIAGSFSDWQPQEMHHTVSDGEYTFAKEIEVEAGKDYQYKFRVGEGEGDWWLLDEAAPVVTDELGNRNNLLTVPIHEGGKITEAQQTADTEDPPHSTMAENTALTPTLTVNKVDSKPKYGDDFGEYATVAQKNAHNLRALDAEPDHFAVRSAAHTPDFASNAAEVADSAMALDREAATPPISDEDAGRIGYRRMSQTPIPEVAETAAEVADSAATLDKDSMLTLEMPPIPKDFKFDQPDTPDSGVATPTDEKVPLFAHECIKPPPGGFEKPLAAQRELVKPKPPIQEEVIDYDDPLLEEFPSERGAILERVRTSQSRLPEDETSLDGVPPSPVVGANYLSDRMELPSPSPGFLGDDRSPSLNSIPEGAEEGFREAVLSSLPSGTNLNLSNGEPHLNRGISEDEALPVQKEVRKTSVHVREVQEATAALEPEITQTTTSEDPNLDGAYMEPGPVQLPNTPFVSDNSKQLGESAKQEAQATVSPEDGPQITIQPATPSSSLNTTATNPFNKLVNTAKATALDAENGRSKLTSRKPVAASAERPLTPTSMRSAGKDAKTRNFLKAFWRVVFVEWIGGFIMRLCGGSRNKSLLAIAALLLITLAPAVYFSV